MTFKINKNYTEEFENKKTATVTKRTKKTIWLDYGKEIIKKRVFHNNDGSEYVKIGSWNCISA